jgi:hypothetical protein
MIRSDVTVDDVVQGKLNDCWLVAALACVAAKVPHILWQRTVPVHDLDNTRKTYPVVLLVNGKWTTLQVEPIFPCQRISSTPLLLYARSRRRQLWVPLVEKAFSMIYGSYADLNYGSSFGALCALTGWDGSYRIMRLPQMWPKSTALHKIIEEFDAPFEFLACLSFSSEEEYDHKRITPHHTYAIVSLTPTHIELYDPWSPPHGPRTLYLSRKDPNLPSVHTLSHVVHQSGLDITDRAEKESLSSSR